MQPSHDEQLKTLFRISIHAPYKGCNISQTKGITILPISIHAPYKGCNCCFFTFDFFAIYFNPCTL